MADEEVMNNERTGYINPNTGVRLPIGLLATFVLAVAVFLFNRQDVLNEKIENHYQVVGIELERKADKAAAEDRYTGKDSLADKALYELSIKALQRELVARIDSLEEIIKNYKEDDKINMQHIHEDIKNHYHPHGQIIHESHQ